MHFLIDFLKFVNQNNDFVYKQFKNYQQINIEPTHLIKFSIIEHKHNNNNFFELICHKNFKQKIYFSVT